jgi:hypothetical protein
MLEIGRHLLCWVPQKELTSVTEQHLSESELLYDWRLTAYQFILAASPLRLTTSNFIFQLNTCGYNPYVTSSLTRGWVSPLQLLLLLASAVTLTSESRGTHDHILLSQIRDFPKLQGQVSIFISPRNKVARLYPQALGSLFVASVARYLSDSNDVSTGAEESSLLEAITRKRVVKAN